MQSFALADAKLCVGGCKALRWLLQSFALAHAMLCVSGCNAMLCVTDAMVASADAMV